MTSLDVSETVFVRVLREAIADPVQGVESEEALLHAAIQSGEPHLRLWRNAPCIVLGRGYARRLPNKVEQVANLPVLVRSSGGEIVIHGPGVLNVSLVVPTRVWDGTIHEGFTRLSAAVARALIRLGWRAAVGEIPGSYCPGDHDVSVDGKKVMGISQRRVREGVLVHGSLNMAIDPEVYAHILASFYAAAGIEEHPQVERIGTLLQTPMEHPSACPVAAEIVKTVLEYWSESMGCVWTERL